MIYLYGAGCGVRGAGYPKSVLTSVATAIGRKYRICENLITYGC